MEKFNICKKLINKENIKNILSKKNVITFAPIIFIISLFAIFLNGNVLKNSFDNREYNSTVTDLDQEMYVLTIKYMYTNGTLASPKDVYCYFKDEDIDLTIPQIDGYTSSLDKIVDTADDNYLTDIEDLDYVTVVKEEDSNIYRIYYTINYTPAPSEYKVVHYLQNLDGSTYTKYFEEVNNQDVYIGDKVSTEVAEYEGFTFNTEKSITTANVNKDGTTELSLYYDRNKYYIYVVDSGDNYFEPIVKLYGESIEI